MADLSGHIMGRYRLREKIGQGGMATVYKAFDTVRGCHVAIKVLSPAMAQIPQFIQRFQREVKLAKDLQHPHIVPVLDFGELGGYVYLVMPFIRGGTLADRMKEGGDKPIKGARLIEQISSALAYAHAQGIVHRDVKPSNILLDEDGNALLADFGLAHIHNASVSLTGDALIGTPAYISPEQVQGKDVDAQADQYALGILLFQLATGKMPFEGGSTLGVLIKHISEPLPTPRSIKPDLPEVIEAVIRKATAKKPEHRFESVETLNAAFQAALAHIRAPRTNPPPEIDLSHELPPVQAGSDGRGVRSSRKRRSAMLVGLAALFFVLLLACPVLSTGVLNFLDGLSNPAQGSSLYPEDLSAPQLTALAGTIQALSTEVASANMGTLSPAQIQTVVMQTIVVQTVVVTNTVVANPEGTILSPSWTPGPTGTIIFPSVPPQPAPTNTSQFEGPFPTLPPDIFPTPVVGSAMRASRTPTPQEASSAWPSHTPTRTSTIPPGSTTEPEPTRRPTRTPTRALSPTSTSPSSNSPTATARPSETSPPTNTPLPTATWTPTQPPPPTSTRSPTSPPYPPPYP